MKLAIVVQRYGADINGGAELHARYVAEHLARHVETEVLTTCARDYITWRNELRPGIETINGVTVRRFPVRRPRSPGLFARRSRPVFDESHSIADELAWLESEGPASPALIDYMARSRGRYDYFLLFSYRYYHAYHGARAAAGRAVLVPTAERDEAIGVSLFGPVFRSVRAIMYNSFEERAMIAAAAQSDAVPGIVVGIGSEVPDAVEPERFRQKYDIRGPFAIYVGRIDENKGCAELFAHFRRYAAVRRRRPLTLVRVGNPVIPIPDYRFVRHLGFLDDRDKFDAMAGADLLLMPSRFESLSMVTLEAWALGRPVLATGACDVLKGQCLRSNAGLYYENEAEFVEALCALQDNPDLAAGLGRNGREYFREHYAWPVIEGKYLRMLERLEREDPPGAGRSIDPLPGWWARRQKTLRPARLVLADLPVGPVGGTQEISATC